MGAFILALQLDISLVAMKIKQEYISVARTAIHVCGDGHLTRLSMPGGGEHKYWSVYMCN